MEVKTEETEPETVTVLTTQTGIWKKLNELAGTDNKFEIVFPSASSRSNFDPKTDEYPDHVKGSRIEKGFKLQFEIPKNQDMIGDSIYVPLKQIEKVTIGEPDEEGRKIVAIFHSLK